METLSSQAFGKMENYLANCYYTRAQVILTAIFIPQAILLFFSTPILMAVGMPEVSAIHAGTYIKIMIPGCWGYCQAELLRRYLGTQGAFHIVVYAQILNCILHPFWLYFFVFVLDLSMEGVAFGTSITYFMNYLVPIIYVSFNKSILKENSWHWINKDSFKGLFEYLRYGIPSMIMVAMESWAVEVIIIMSGLLGEFELAACVMMANIMAFAYMIPCGFSLATNTLVGNNLGASNPTHAKMYVNISL